jgi:hypothetical protein
MALETESYSLDVLSDSTGSSPEVSVNLKVKNRVINSVNQAFSVCETLRNDWKDGITKAARITAKINGERPYSQKKLENAGKGWKTNISTGFLATECSKVTPRFYMPIKTAKYLTASSLPPGYPDGEAKTEFFRQAITEVIRTWPKFNFFIRGLAREVGVFGFGFCWFPDEFDWRPTLVRMDKGFVPQGTEVMETEPAFFMAKFDYKPSELLELLKDSVDNGRSEWNKDNVVAALNNALPPPTESTIYEARSYEELIRQSVWQYTYTKGNKLIETWHLFAREADGRVSHYILLSGNQSGNPNYNYKAVAGSSKVDSRLLYENLDQFDSMTDVVNTLVFDYGDGTVHGSWGAGQILYDLAAQVEKVRCDSIDNMRTSNKIKAQVPEAKNVNDVKLSVDDTMVIVSGAQFAGNMASMPQDINGYEVLDQKLTRIAQEKIGAFVPPIPLTPSDIKAAQVNAQVLKERELQEALLENWLIQFAVVVKTITKRLCKKGSPDDTAKGLVKILKERLTDEEIKILSEQFPVQSVADFTEYSAQKRGMFAQSVMGNPLFRQSVAARIMAEGAGDVRFVEEIVKPEGDEQDSLAAMQKQQLENAAMAIGQNVPVLENDNDWVHMETMKPGLMKTLEAGNVQLAQIGLQHYAAHYAQGVAKKGIPKDKINEEKSLIAAIEKQIAAIQESEQIKQQTQQAEQQAAQQAQAIVQGQQSMA